MAVQLLGDGLRDSSLLVDALLELLGDPESSHHGRNNAATALAELSVRKPHLRITTIEAIAATLIEHKAGLGSFERGCLVGLLVDLRATECHAVVRKAFKSGLVDAVVVGGYDAYLEQLGLPIDLNDRVVVDSVRSPFCSGARGR